MRDAAEDWPEDDCCSAVEPWVSAASVDTGRAEDDVGVDAEALLDEAATSDRADASAESERTTADVLVMEIASSTSESPVRAFLLDGRAAGEGSDHDGQETRARKR